ncbi:GNAT family N-acetyltransferase [Clostridium argentinense]|nr:GNAT family N-acetyltransferase [Clostridium argentinense]NFP51821.1 GNAT family N-acetyltransferase [Clostridium argentinense]NFP73906.1 GNAT family N-acetyltransferase [Clostridium argentinense]NFP78395.1 GNAT family N-acetyltransferase [Clostridium argentinense]
MFMNLKEIQLKSGEKLILRRPMIEDAKRIIEYVNIVGGESNNLLFGKDEFHLTVEEEKEHIKRMNNDSNSLMILGIIDDNIVSLAQITSSNRKRIAHNSEVSISVKKDYWRNGIGSAVMEEIIRFAREGSVIKNISLGVRASNINAIKMYEELGFVKVGLHKNYFNINDNFDDEILMDLYI